MTCIPEVIRKSQVGLSEKLTDMELTKAKRAIAKIIGDVRMAIDLAGNKSVPTEKLTEMGYAVVKDGYWRTYAIKDGIKVIINFYNSNYTYKVDYGFYFGKDSYCHFSDIDKRINDVIASGFSFTYERGADLQKFIDNLKFKIQETKKHVESRGVGCIGGYMRSRGYFVSYNGDSLCAFSKDGIQYNASDGKHWQLKNRISLYVKDDVLSDEFSYEDKKGSINGIDYIELYIGDNISLGRELTEKDKLNTYTKFRVRTYSDRYLDTVKWFDDFEKAKKFAYDLAVQKAKSVSPQYKDWANTNPKDRGEEFDMLACFVWYECSPNSKHLVFVQGEKD